MTNESAYQHVKKYINNQHIVHHRFLGEKEKAAAKETLARALAFLATLRTEEPTPQTPPLVADPMPVDYTPELSVQLDQLDKAIDVANGKGDYARATALRDRKGKMLRSLGL